MHEADGVHRSRRNEVKSLTNKNYIEKVNGDIIVRAGVINPVNCTALRASRACARHLAKCASREN